MANCTLCGHDITWAGREDGGTIALEQDAQGEYVIRPPRTVSGPSLAMLIGSNDPLVQQQVSLGHRFVDHEQVCKGAAGKGGSDEV